MVRCPDAGGFTPALYGRPKAGNTMVYEQEPRDTGLEPGPSRFDTCPDPSAGCCKMCKKILDTTEEDHEVEAFHLSNRLC